MKGLRTLLCMMIGLVIGSIAGITIVNVSHKKMKKNVTEELTTEELTTETAATVTDAMTPMDATQTEAATQTDTTEAGKTEITEDEQPAALTEILKKSLVTYAALQEVDCRQLMVVCSDQTTAEISMYVRDEAGKWSDAECSTTGYVGSNGVSRDSYEGSRMTPAGVFPIGDAFYIDQAQQTGLNVFQVTENTYWVDDPESAQYNQRVELSGEKTWNSAEHMIDYTSAYKYGFVVKYNMNPVEAGRGSAIFFHVGSQATLGCIATSEDMVLTYLSKLSADQNPYILIQ